MINTTWSAEEEELLRKFYGTMNNKELAEKYFPNKSVQIIQAKATKEGLTVWEDSHDEVLKILKNNSVPEKLIAKVLKRSENAVQSRANKLGYQAQLTKVFDDSKYVQLQNEYLSLDTKLIGTINEELVKVKLATEGFDVFIPFMSNTKADLIILQGRTPVKIQVKSAGYRKTGKVFFAMLKTKTKGKFIEYKEKDIDFFIVKCNGIEEYYIIPYSVSLNCSAALLYPHRNKIQHRGKVNLEQYRNAFHLIKEKIKEE